MPARSYAQYPAEYAELLMTFRTTGAASLRIDDKSAAYMVRRDLYRYIGAIRAAASEDEDDPFLRDLYEASRNVMVRMREDDGAWHIDLTLNPVVAAMRQRPTGT